MSSTIAVPSTEYPKIDTLYDRDPENKRYVIPGQLRSAEFGLVKQWLVTEKIDGTNVRVIYGNGDVRIGGRTDDASMPLYLHDIVRAHFTVDRLSSVWPSLQEVDPWNTPTDDPSYPRIVLYGEGYGFKVNKRGSDYRAADHSFRLFDVRVWGSDGKGGEKWWWLSWDNVADVAAKLGIETAPVLARAATLEEALALVTIGSVTAMEEGNAEVMHEGIVARTEPLLLDRRENRVIWKLKGRDLA